MTRCLHVLNGFVTNIVEYPNGHPLKDPTNGADVIPAVTGFESVGDSFDVTSSLRDNLFNTMDAIVIKELFRLTNEARVLQLKAQLTFPQYAAFLKSLMP